jgi:sugar phosphate isomerase/epimerase
MTKLTMLSWMASKDFVESLDLHKAWGIEVLDLKDHIMGKSVADLTVDEAQQAKQLIDDRNLSVYCLSTSIFQDHIELGEQQFKHIHLAALERVLQIAPILKPTVVRLLPVRFKEPHLYEQSAQVVPEQYPWLYPLYQEAIDKLSAAGFAVAIENERESILSSIANIEDFFRRLDRPGKVFLTYDVQNLWQMGTYPTLEVYNRLKPLIGYYHAKGGQENPETKALQWKSYLKNASWPVEEITKQVVRDGICSVICINPTHGKINDDYNEQEAVRKNLEYLKSIIQN